jgi:hypothetical protein
MNDWFFFYFFKFIIIVSVITMSGVFFYYYFNSKYHISEVDYVDCKQKKLFYIFYELLNRFFFLKKIIIWPISQSFKPLAIY